MCGAWKVLNKRTRFRGCEFACNDHSAAAMLVGTLRCDVRTAQRAVPTSESIDVCQHLSTELLFAGGNASSAGTARKTGGLDRGTGQETASHSIERGRRKGGHLQRNDAKSGSSAIFGGCHQGARAHTGKIDPGNFAPVCVYAQPVCRSHRTRSLHDSIY